MSLADELLADFEDAETEDVNDIVDEDQLEAENERNGDDVMEVADGGGDAINNSVRAVAKLRDSKNLNDIVKDIDYYIENPRAEQVLGPVEVDPEYLLIVNGNNMAVEIDNEISIIHKYVRDTYTKRFPELESLIEFPFDYIRTVQRLGNELNTDLSDILIPANVMVVSVTASTTQGTKLDDDELERVLEACKVAIELMDIKIKIFQYVESRMSFIAPNLSVIAGASVAAKIMGTAGGLTALSKMPACNIMVLGSVKKSLSGFSTSSIMPHTGNLYYSDIVQNSPPDLRKKAARLVAAKCALAARVDSFHEAVDGSIGQNLRDDIEKKLDKLQEPPPLKKIKPLIVPGEYRKKKRGGRRVRKLKEKAAVTELRKQANRMTFGQIEEDAYQGDLGFSLGQLGQSTSGKVRGAPVDKKTQVSVSKKLQKTLQQDNQTYGGRSSVRGATSGTASSVAFTPLQGLEIVNPLAAEKKAQEANAKYFSANTGFRFVKK
ncbi:uncharacterized protein TRIADDRAFT_20768 [Trichoplax adhaerens]|uniref:U4/U6 small nuclear ribonucleoprotein Prp31 n=1 Tax=Trichoplax adhaerens TaxID=10228 RepID=B3RML9_TRIAD|nr:hypothetical protein TRIADDRAFT_20768 [Trichoplax adhaerens]EDV27298.1 hypothetical protein TRIADDRAFT_20768 [Trichoplax adhaerens]|eukprot:XP_002109132.1 hypothetical protein TRIADDRAFT_20768 [Trichoplax adhaerens]